MRFGVLGPLLVQSGEEIVPVRRGRQRAVLAVLLLNAGRVVSVEKLVDVLWGENPPPSAGVAVRNYVMRLRRDLGPAGDRIRTRPPGYLISVGEDEFDLSRFEARLDSAQAAAGAGSWDTAAREAAAALELWRGDPLCDVESDVLARREAPRLAELRLRAVETRIEADLNLERHAEVVPELEHLTAAHPLRENPRAQLMLALYRSGRQAEALGVYRDARQALIDGLGVEPGEALRDLHQRILSGDPALSVSGSAAVTEGPGTVVPRQLPPAPARFVGRDGELKALFRLLSPPEGRPPGSVVISAIGGTAGVGKTALAVHWAHQVSDQFPDGQLYVNLRGYDPGPPVSAANALAGFLRALGLPGERIPADTDERAAAFRTLLDGRRALIVLDNAKEADQVRPLVPGSSSCLVVITSRDAMAGLVARDGAERIDLDLLPAEEAARHLRELIGERAAADPDAVARIGGCCCRLPLALRVAAELANSRPGVPLADLAAELADRQRRLDLLDADGDSRTAVREVFSWSCRNLDAATARIFRLAGLHPGADFDAYAIAALAGISLADARAALGRLARAHLVQLTAAERYGFHDLLREYAREIAAQDGEEQCSAALTRLFNYYAHTATVAAQAAYPAAGRHRGVFPATPPEEVPPVTESAPARRWLDDERDNLTAVAIHTADNRGWPDHPTTLSTVLFKYFIVTSRHAEARTVHSCALRAARAGGDKSREARALNNLAALDWRLGRLRSVLEILTQARDLYRESRDEGGEARALSNLATVSWRLGHCQDALGFQQQALAIHREAGDREAEAYALQNLGNLNRILGRITQSVQFLQQALALYREAGDRYGEACTLKDLADTGERMAQCQEASSNARQALMIFRDIGDQNGEADALISLARIYRRTGQYQDAIDHIDQALALYRELNEQSGEARALNVLGGILRAAGDPVQARARHDAALTAASRESDLHEEALARQNIGCICSDSGDLVEARSHWERALTLYMEMGIPEAEEVRVLLAGLPDPVPVQRDAQGGLPRGSPSRSWGLRGFRRKVFSGLVTLRSAGAPCGYR